ncbi:hypothetical protein B0H12DRAFT_1278947 [Mycena haematopus]|nr:hypothetical protein B0H12DRAFT_1278947 [Mycena haematopus]
MSNPGGSTANEAPSKCLADKSESYGDEAELSLSEDDSDVESEVEDVKDAICILTNAPGPTAARQFCHAMARSTSHATLTMLEWWWQMDYLTVYIDTRYNIFALMADWHFAMDARDWVLILKHDLITQVLRWTEDVVGSDPNDLTKRQPISQMYGKQTEFEYYILPLSTEMKHVHIHRLEPSANLDPTAVVPRAVSVSHRHPFSTIGPITSHVHPHFVIHSAGQKLANLTKNRNPAEYEALYSDLAAAASFGHKADEARSVMVKNRDSIDTLISLYRTWSQSQGVPERGTGHPWRQHLEAPSDAQEERAEKVWQKRKENAAAEKAKEKRTHRRR